MFDEPNAKELTFNEVDSAKEGYLGIIRQRFNELGLIYYLSKPLDELKDIEIPFGFYGTVGFTISFSYSDETTMYPYKDCERYARVATIYTHMNVYNFKISHFKPITRKFITLLNEDKAVEMIAEIINESLYFIEPTTTCDIYGTMKNIVIYLDCSNEEADCQIEITKLLARIEHEKDEEKRKEYIKELNEVNRKYRQILDKQKVETIKTTE
jgi:hypothetical protein